MKLRKDVDRLLKISNKLDKEGRYTLADSVFNLLKISQFSPTPTQLPTTQIDLPESLRPFLSPETFKDNVFVNKNWN